MTTTANNSQALLKIGLDNFVADCDKRIAVCKEKLDKNKKKIDEVVKGLEWKKVKEDLQIIYTIKENEIKLLKIEKIILRALYNPNSKREIFKHLLAKYNELLCVDLEHTSNMVQIQILTEQNYLDMCKRSKEQHEYIRTLCCCGYKGNID
jgi:hypothetical protein